MLIRCTDGWAQGGCQIAFANYDRNELVLTEHTRANLEQERSRSEYERGYKKVLSWFHEYL